MCTAPGILPRFTSWRSRTSRKVTPGSFASSSASVAFTCLMRVFASLMRSVPLFIRVVLRSGGSAQRDVQRARVGVELSARAERDGPLIVDVPERHTSDGGDAGE